MPFARSKLYTLCSNWAAVLELVQWAIQWLIFFFNNRWGNSIHWLEPTKTLACQVKHLNSRVQINYIILMQMHENMGLETCPCLQINICIPNVHYEKWQVLGLMFSRVCNRFSSDLAYLLTSDDKSRGEAYFSFELKHQKAWHQACHKRP